MHKYGSQVITQILKLSKRASEDTDTTTTIYGYAKCINEMKPSETYAPKKTVKLIDLPYKICDG